MRKPSERSSERKHADRMKINYQHARRQVRDERAALKQAKRDRADTTRAQALIQAVAQRVQQSAHQQIASIVSRCLSAVFGEGAYKFKIHFDRKRGKTEARMVLVRGGAEFHPMDAAGGGVIDVASFALRVAALILTQPARRRLLVLDEPFKHVSAEYRPRVREMIETLADELSIQFLIVTHSSEFEIGKVVRL